MANTAARTKPAASQVVFVLLTKSGGISSINSSLADAESKRDAFNSDPFLSPGVPDLAAPYRVEPWSVR